MSNFPHHPGPTQVERHIPDYFHDWLIEVKELERQRQQSKGQSSMSHISPFGIPREDAWHQWKDFVMLIDDPHAFDDREPDEER